MTAEQKSIEASGIILENVVKSYNGVPVLNGVSLSIAPIGVTVLMGPSGCGKTTLCSLLLGLEKPDSGVIQNPYHRISCAFQDPRLFPWMTAVENIMLSLSGTSKNEKREKAEAMLLYLGLKNAQNKRPAELSGGMQQRVSLIRAFLSQHDFLILDEPFRGLDDGNKALVTDLIRRESERSPVLLVTHDLSDVDSLNGNRILLG